MGAYELKLDTQPYADAFARKDFESVLKKYASAASGAQSVGLGVNTGHDLNLQNLGRFGPFGVLEVSIGHALVGDALEMGFHNAVKANLHVLAANP